MTRARPAGNTAAVIPQPAGIAMAGHAYCATHCMPHPKRALRDEVHVWLVEPVAWRRAFGDDGLILSAEERIAADTFTLGTLRERYMTAHGAVRRLLSLYVDMSPVSWVLRRGTRGKPFIAGNSDLRFSLSYGDDLIAIAIARNVELGIDIISTHRRVDVMQIAEYVFAQEEIADLRAVGADLARDRFFDFWALKEAYAKATGAGFWENPNRYAFSFPRQDVIAFRHDSNEDDRPWQFVLGCAPRDHRLAVAVRSREGQSRKIIARMAPSGEVAALAADRAYGDGKHGVGDSIPSVAKLP